MRNQHFLLLCLLLIAHLLSAQSFPACTSTNPTGADDCANACLVCDLNNYSGTTAGFTPSAGPLFCGSVENDQWLGFVAGTSYLTITATANCQNNKGLELALYPDCNSAPLACAASNGSGTVSVSTPATAGTSYFLRIDGVKGDVCSFVLNATPAGATAPPLVIAAQMQGPTSTFGFESHVYSVPPVTGAFFYTWNSPAGAKINGQTPPITLAAPAGTQVTVTFGEQTSGTVCVKPGNACQIGQENCKNVTVVGNGIPPCPNSNTPAADNCSDVCTFCDFSTYTGSTAGYTPDTPAGFCGTIENNEWIGFIASTSTVTISGNASNCTLGNGIQLAVYTDCFASAPLPNSCDTGCVNCAGKPISITFNTIPGRTYYLMIDGWAGDQCDFTLNVTPHQKSVPLGTIGAISGPATICPGGGAEYSIAPVSGAATYVWDAPAGYLINGVPPPVTASGDFTHVTVTAGNTSGTLCVAASNSCEGPTPFKCKTITVSPTIPPTVLPPATVCAEAVPYTLPWGDQALGSGTYSHTYTSYKGCDSIVQKQVTVKSKIVHNLALQTICAGDFITIGGETYSQAGSYSKVFTSYQGCDSTVNFTIEILQPVANILGSGQITCTNTAVPLSSDPSTGTKSWKDANDQVVGTGDTFTASSAGTYFLEVTVTSGGQSCLARDTIVITGNTTPPVVNASGGQINCLHPQTQLNVNSNQPNSTFSWAGPGGFSSTEQSPIIEDLGGNYTVTVTNPLNGCTASATAFVGGNTNLPQATAVGGTIDCYNGSVIIHGTSTTPNAQFSWFGPMGFASSIANPAVTQPGVYSLVVTDPTNACRTTVITTVIDNRIIPGVYISGDTVLDCLHPTQTLSAVLSSTSTQFGFNWASAGGFHATTQSVQVSEPGLYQLQVTDLSNGCINTTSIKVVGHTNLPVLTILADTITCAKPQATIHLNTNAATPSFTWQGPGGFTSAGQSPVVTTSGQYTVTATDGGNGCTTIGHVTVPADLAIPDVSTIAGGLIPCNGNPITIQGYSATAGATYTWLTPNGPVNQQNLEVGVPGLYVLVVTGPNGCTNADTVAVAQESGGPLISISGLVLTCTHDSLQLGYLPFHDYLSSWIGPNGFTATTPEVWATAPGIYNLVATNPANGCSTTVSFGVSANFDVPTITSTIIINDLGNQHTGAITIEVTGGVMPYAFQWYLNGQPFSNLQNLNGLAAGQYHVVITGANGCIDTANIIVHGFVATQEPAKEDLWKVFPNPATAFLTVQFEGDQAPEAQFRLFDATGRVVRESFASGDKLTKLNIDQLPSGAYALSIQTKSGTTSRVISIQR